MAPRISALSNEQVTQPAARILESVERAVGMVPNLHRTLAHAPAALQAYVATASALSAGSLDAKLRESLAIAVGALNGCQYCASAHTTIGRGAGIDDTELSRNLRGESESKKVGAALAFAKALIEQRGALATSDLEKVRAFFSDEEIVEIVSHVGMNMFTNMFNVLAQTEIDFPVVEFAGSR